MNCAPKIGDAFNAIPPEAVLATVSFIVGPQTGVPVIVRNAGTSMTVVPFDIAIRVAASAGSIGIEHEVFFMRHRMVADRRRNEHVSERVRECVM